MRETPTKLARTAAPEITTETEQENAHARADDETPNCEEPAPSEPKPRKPELGTPAEARSGDDENIKRGPGYVGGMLLAPPLAAGENLDDYIAVARQVRQVVDPKTFFDELRASDITHALWEEKRYRKQLVAFPNAARFKALVALTAQISPNFDMKASSVALDYFGPDKERSDAAKRFFGRYGITDDAITAMATELHASTIGIFERMVSNRQNRRNGVIKEVERDKRRAEKKKAKTNPKDCGPTAH
jgi:hypothetical protein